MKIAFAIDILFMSGGIIVVLEHAVRLKKYGHEVYILTWKDVSAGALSWFDGAGNLNWRTYEQASTIHFDFALSTGWPTCYNLYRISAEKYVYFNQSIESKFYTEKERINKNKADSTYLLGLNIITEATWIRNYLKNNFGLHAELVLNGIRKDLFTMAGKAACERDDNKLRVLVEGPLHVPFKNVKRAIQICRQSMADEIWLLTSTKLRFKRLRGVDRVFSKVPFNKTPEIYRSCDVLVKLSFIEGMFGPPLEMFHCGGTAVVYNVTGYDEYIVHNENALVAEMGDEQAVLRHINSLKTDRNLLNDLKKGARETAASWHDWDESSKQFENALLKIDQNPLPTRQQLRVKTEIIEQWHQIFFSGAAGWTLKAFIAIKRRIRLYFFRAVAFAIAPFKSSNKNTKP